MKCKMLVYKNSWAFFKFNYICTIFKIYVFLIYVFLSFIHGLNPKLKSPAFRHVYLIFLFWNKTCWCRFTFLIHSFLSQSLNPSYIQICAGYKKTEVNWACIYFSLYLSHSTDQVSVEYCTLEKGRKQNLNFSYPCESTKTTLQHSHKAPFYSSENPESKPLPPRYELANHPEKWRWPYLLYPPNHWPCVTKWWGYLYSLCI